MVDVKYVAHTAERRALTEKEALADMKLRIRKVFPDIVFQDSGFKGNRVHIASNYGENKFEGTGESRDAALSALWDNIVTATKHPDGVREQWGTENKPVITYEDGHFVEIPQAEVL